MTRQKILIFTSLAILAATAFWIGGYSYFIYSYDWQLIQKSIADSPVVKSEVGSVKNISTSPWGFSYKYSGNWADIKLRVHVAGDKGGETYIVNLERAEGSWDLSQIDRI